MKTAISLPDDLFAVADKYANENGLTRSALIAEALREYIDKHKSIDLTLKINEAIQHIGQPRDSAVIARSSTLLRNSEW